MVAGIIIAGGIQTQVSASSAFDLICSTNNGQKLHFRFDTLQKKWCLDECVSVWFIDELSDNTIKLVTYSEDDSNNWTFIINRYNSEFSAINRGRRKDSGNDGRCAPQGFSGFPSRKF